MAKPVFEVKRQLAAVQDHSRHYSDFTYVYPVISRRSRGLSLGINVNPDKVCNYDCIYCEVDRTTPGKKIGVDIAQIRAELSALIELARNGGLAKEWKFRPVAELTREIKDIAFSGEGEPTMIRHFADCIQAVAEVKKSAGLSTTKIVLITNAAGLDKADVRRGLEIMDANQGEIWGKLDAGTEAYYKLVNRSFIRFDRILKNLLVTAQARPIIIQTLFLKVHDQVMPKAELEAYCARLQEMVQAGAKFKAVHAYTVARPTPETYATPLSADELEQLAETVRKAIHLPVFMFP